jgi:coenzyme F420-reducing hydrogenase gamma subunit
MSETEAQTGKPRAAFFDFTGCEGCQLKIVNLEEELLNLVEVVEIVNFREATSRREDDYDIAFIEGSAVRDHDAERLEEIRENADLVVTIGSCSSFAGINALRNDQDLDTVKERVYGDDVAQFDDVWDEAKPAEAVIDVDYNVPGCPIDKQEFVQVVNALVQGVEPRIPTYPVCIECKMNENHCAFERGEVCLGPVTRGGCDAVCVSNGLKCWGCRGLVPDANKDAHEEVLEEYGLSAEEIIKEFDLFTKWQYDEMESKESEPKEVVQ